MTHPPFTITAAILRKVAEISESLGRLSVQREHMDNLRLRRANRIRTIHGSLAIEGNTLTEEQITAILNGKPVIAPPREVQEVRNALQAYDLLERWQPGSEDDLLAAHGLLMQGLMDDAGHYRSGGVGVMSGSEVIHMAPPARRVPELMAQLLAWLEATDQHPLIASCVFHYEFEFIHPFADGNGRMGRLWQTLMLSRWNPLFVQIPVESLVHAHQGGYYRAIADSTAKTDSAPFIEFMLSMILEAVRSPTEQATHQVIHQVTHQVTALLEACVGEMNRADLMAVLALKDRVNFRQAYLEPALEQGLVEMTQPDSPRSPTQKYRLTQLGRQVLATKDTH
jgi:Fic family protein